VRRDRLLGLAAGAVVLALAGAAAYGFGGRGGGPAPAAATATKTAVVTRMTLVDAEDANGLPGFGAVTPLRFTPPKSDSADAGLGVLTWIPPIGSTVERGQPVLRVDDRPVALLYGALPLFRALKSGVTGNDVEQLETNLHELGYTGFTVDQEYTDATAAAVKRWQQALGVLPSGEVDPGAFVVAPGPLRVAEQRLRVGDVATGDIRGTTGTRRSVTVTVSRTRLRSSADPGTAVTVLLPDGKELPGTVSTAAPAASSGPGAQPGQDVDVTVDVADQAALDGREGAATVRFVVSERRDVLAVPVLALVALAEGGYGLQVVDGDGTRYVAVRTGLFARGFVELSGGDVAEGTRVVMPDA
jgi:peptidoglycan hydrolase-like protein with peptidoglycan-binding domain